MSDEITLFGKKHKLDKFGEFKIGRIHVSVLQWGDLWRADIFANGGDTHISVGAKSRSAALKKLEKRIEWLQKQFDGITCNGQAWTKKTPKKRSRK